MSTTCDINKGYVILKPRPESVLRIFLFTPPFNSMAEVLVDIEKELREQNYNDWVIFDQLLIKGDDADNRYMWIMFKNGRFDICTTHKLEDNTLSGLIENLTIEYLHEHYYLVEYSALQKKYREKIKSYEPKEDVWVTVS